MAKEPVFGPLVSDVRETALRRGEELAKALASEVMDDEFDPTLGVDVEDLDSEFARWSGLYACRSRVAAKADAAYMRAKNAAKRVRALVLLEVLLRSSHPGTQAGKKPTESILEALVETDDRVQLALEEEVEALREKRRLEGELDALLGKRDMLQQIGAKRRKELTPEPVTRYREWTRDRE